MQFPDFDPVLIHLGPIAIRWYGLAYVAGILLGWRYAVSLTRNTALWGKTQPTATPLQIDDLILWITFGIIVGGRLGSAIFYDANRMISNPLEVFKIWQGGMSFHGGFLGVCVAVALFARHCKIDLLRVGDLVAAATPFGLLFGRIANFINGELWGRPTDMPWGVAFPGEAAQTCEGILTVCARHPSQLYEAALEGLLLFAVLTYGIWRAGWLRFGGRVAGVFFAGYGLSRFVVEFFRQPDAQFVSEGNPLGLAWQMGGYGLTMGQLLTLPMIVAGAWFIARARAA